MTNKKKTTYNADKRRQKYLNVKAKKAAEKKKLVEEKLRALTMPGEQWANISGFDNQYKVSNFGRVFSSKTLKIQEQTPNSSGYLRVHLINKRKDSYVFVHRLVARYFVPNPDFKSIVNHKDGDKHNNLASNLEWVTASENRRHALDVLHVNATPIACYDAETKTKVNTYYYLVDAIKDLKTSYKTLQKALREGTLAKGMYWQYAPV